MTAEDLIVLKLGGSLLTDKSTAYKLREKVKESKIYWAEKRTGVNDKIVTSEIKTKLKLIKLNGRKSA